MRATILRRSSGPLDRQERRRCSPRPSEAGRMSRRRASARATRLPAGVPARRSARRRTSSRTPAPAADRLGAGDYADEILQHARGQPVEVHRRRTARPSGCRAATSRPKSADAAPPSRLRRRRVHEPVLPRGLFACGHRGRAVAERAGADRRERLARRAAARGSRARAPARRARARRAVVDADRAAVGGCPASGCDRRRPALGRPGRGLQSGPGSPPGVRRRRWRSRRPARRRSASGRGAGRRARRASRS